MIKSRFGSATLALAVATVPTYLACAGPSLPTSATDRSTSSIAALSTAEAARSSDGRSPDDEPRAGRATLTEALDRSGSGVDGAKGSTEPGTDSIETSPAPAVNAEVRALLTRFAELYLGYDYREDPRDRFDALAVLIDPAVFDELVTPLPPALSNALIAEQRVMTAMVASITGVDTLADGSGVYQLSSAITEASSGTTGTTGAERHRTLTVVLGADQLIEDVR